MRTTDLRNAIIFANDQFMNERVIQSWPIKCKAKLDKEFLPLKEMQETKRLAESLRLKTSHRGSQNCQIRQKGNHNMEHAQLPSFQCFEMMNFLYCRNQTDNVSVISNWNILDDLLQMGDIHFTPGCCTSKSVILKPGRMLEWVSLQKNAQPWTPPQTY